jgi:hypothetical protein
VQDAVLPFRNPVTAGNAIVVALGFSHGDAPNAVFESVTDSLGNAFTTILGPVDDSGDSARIYVPRT